MDKIIENYNKSMDLKIRLSLFLLLEKINKLNKKKSGCSRNNDLINILDFSTKALKHLEVILDDENEKTLQKQKIHTAQHCIYDLYEEFFLCNHTANKLLHKIDRYLFGKETSPDDSFNIPLDMISADCAELINESEENKLKIMPADKEKIGKIFSRLPFNMGAEAFADYVIDGIRELENFNKTSLYKSYLKILMPKSKNEYSPYFADINKSLDDLEKINFGDKTYKELAEIQKQLNNIKKKTNIKDLINYLNVLNYLEILITFLDGATFSEIFENNVKLKDIYLSFKNYFDKDDFSLYEESITEKIHEVTEIYFNELEEITKRLETAEQSESDSFDDFKNIKDFHDFINDKFREFLAEDIYYEKSEMFLNELTADEILEIKNDLKNYAETQNVDKYTNQFNMQFLYCTLSDEKVKNYIENGFERIADSQDKTAAYVLIFYKD